MDLHVRADGVICIAVGFVLRKGIAFSFDLRGQEQGPRRRRVSWKRLKRFTWYHVLRRLTYVLLPHLPISFTSSD